jgi:uncharacterized coiled-coil DUF342 family protein
MTEQSLNVFCPLCGSQPNGFNVSNSNLRFLLQRLDEKNLDDAITLSAVAWNNFPGLKLTADSKVVVNGLLKGIENQVNKAVAPLDRIIMMIQPLSQKLEGLAAKLPEDLRKEFNEINGQLTAQVKTIQDIAKGVAEPVQRDVKELSLSINAMINKPTSLGTVKEETLKLSWQEVFMKDKTCRKGGPGQPDLVVVPFLELSGARFGQKIIVERKAGKQKYCGTHLQEAIEHTRAEGSHYGILVYDTCANLLEIQKPFYLTMAQEMTIAITDIESGGWKTAREIFEVFQSLLPNEASNANKAIDIGKLQRTIDEIVTINQQIETLRKFNNSALSNCEKARIAINGLEELIVAYQEKLRDLLCKSHPKIWQSEKLIQENKIPLS